MLAVRGESQPNDDGNRGEVIVKKVIGHRLWMLVIGVLSLGGCAEDTPWNVLVVSFDTTRADHMASYGHPRASTPNVDRLAADGTRFDWAYTSVPITLPSHSTIFTGTYPMFHGVRDNGVFVLADRNLTLAEILADAGYATGAAVGSFPLTAKFGIDQGFDFFDDRVAQRAEDFLGERALPRARLYFDERPAGLVNEALLPWLRENIDAPFFAWAHYFDPHQPFEPPPPYDQLFASDLYLGEIAYADECLGVLLDELEALGVADRTLVVLVSDHGEGLGDHNELTHSILAYNSTLRVPMVVKIPGGSSRVVESRVGTVDLVPTVLDLLGIEVPEVVQGTSRAPDIRGTGTTPPDALYAETLSPRIAHGWGELRVLFDEDLKFIFGPRPELFDLAEDPDEYHDLTDVRADDTERMRNALDAFVEVHRSDSLEAAVEMDEATRRQLAALGYLQTNADSELEIEEVLRDDGVPPQERVGDINSLSRAKQLLFQRHSLVARDAIEDLLAADPGNPAYLEMLAMAELQLGRYDEALDVLRSMPGYVQGGEVVKGLMIQLGTVFLYRGDGEAALEMAENSLEIEAQPEAFYLQAMALASLERREEEFAALLAALEVNPDFAPARTNLAIRQAQRGDRESARTNFELATKSQPYDPRIVYNYGAFLVESGDLEGAARYFERAIELGPQYLSARYAFAVVSADLGRWDRVREVAEYLDQRAPESREAESIRALLAEVS